MHQGKKQLNTTITNNNSIMEKKIYEAPMTEVMEIESEGILCASGGINPYEEDTLDW